MGYIPYGDRFVNFLNRRKKVIICGFGGYRNNVVIFSERGLVANRCDDGFFKTYKNKIDMTVVEKNIRYS